MNIYLGHPLSEMRDGRRRVSALEVSARDRNRNPNAISRAEEAKYGRSSLDHYACDPFN